MDNRKYPSDSNLPPEHEDRTEQMNEIKMDTEASRVSKKAPASKTKQRVRRSPLKQRKQNRLLSMRPHSKTRPRNNSGKTRRTVFTVVIAVLLLFAGLGVRMGLQAKQLLTAEKSIKSDIHLLIDSGKELNMTEALRSAESMESEICEANAILESFSWRMLRRVPRLGQDVAGVAQLVSVARDGTEELLIPALEKLQALPLSELKSLDLEQTDTLADAIAELLDMMNEMLPQTEKYLSEILEIPVFHIAKLESKVSEIREACVTVSPILDLLNVDFFDWFREDFAPDLCAALTTYPPDKLIVDEKSFNVRGISEYLALGERILPKIPEVLDAFRQQSEQLPSELSLYIDKLSEKFDQVTAVYDAAEKFLPLLKCYLKNDKDYDYLLVAQNSAEIRALGGFPALVCVLAVRDGIMTMGEFTTIYSMLPGDGEPEDVEIRLFSSAMRANRDAVANPHFPTVASRWADDYQRLGRGELEGVISITPGILYDFFELTGDITLLDGVVVNSENGLRYLENELYLKYLREQNRDMIEYSDEIFADAAQQLMKGIMSDFSLDKLCRCISIFEKHSTDRVIMLWLRDEEEESCIHALGADGGFNDDPRHPQLGIFFNNRRASKLGWYTDIVPEIGEGTTNTDGSISYPVTLVIRNNITRSEAVTAGFYVVKNTTGQMGCNLTLVAPAGGSLGDFYRQRTNIEFYETDYKGNRLAVSEYWLLNPEKEFTFHFTVTTAPGEQTPLTYVTTPTLTAFR